MTDMTTTQPKTLREARRDFERAYILSILEESAWSVGQAARTLGLPRPNLYRKARQLAICLRPPKQESLS
jgi:two-component system, NtrC family, nitrogen regulation response regulator NtrX